MPPFITANTIGHQAAMKILSSNRRATDSFAFKPTLLIMLSILIICGSVFIRAQLAIDIDRIEHDDAISLLSATGHQAEYSRNNEKLAGTWLVAEELKRFISIEDTGVFIRIRDDLIATDIHPPLYFWLLHVWLLIFPIAKFAGPVLNILIFAATSFLLYKTSKLVFRSTPDALAVVAIFAASPVAIDVSLLTRQYELWMFWSVSLLYVGIRFFTQRKELAVFDVFLLSAMLLLGMLTHYYFAITAISIFVPAALLHNKDGRKKFTLSMLVAIVSAALFFVFLPDVLDQLQRQQMQKQAFEFNEIFARLKAVFYALLHFIGWRFWWPKWSEIVVAIGILTPVLYYAIRLREKSSASAKQLTPERLVWCSLLISCGIISILYVLQISPKHAMGSRYIAGMAPLLALAIGLIVRKLTRFHSVVLAAFSVLLAANSLAFHQHADHDATYRDYLRSSSSIIVDNLARGVLFPFVVDVPREARIFAAWRADLVSSPELWVDQLRKGDLLLIKGGYRNDMVKRSLLIDLVSENYEISAVFGDLWVVDRKK